MYYKALSVMFFVLWAAYSVLWVAGLLQDGTINYVANMLGCLALYEVYSMKAEKDG